jgi:hypothetical protein
VPASVCAVPKDFTVLVVSVNVTLLNPSNTTDPKPSVVLENATAELRSLPVSVAE